MKSKLLATLSVATLLASSASAQVYLTSSTGELGTINVHTGAFSSIGHQTNAAGAVVTMGDIAYNSADGYIYGNTYTPTAELAKISTANAAFTTVGTTVYSNSLEFLNYGVLVANEPAGREIYAIDPSNGSTYDTRNFFAVSDARSVYDLVSAPGGSPGVYAIDSTNLWYWANGGSDAVMVGATGFSSVFGLAWWEDVLWGFGFNARGTVSVFSIDLATGAGTFSADITGGDFNSGAYVYGATSAPGAVPEPSTYGMFGAAALLGFLTVRRAKQHRAAQR